jgi:hypothetical protein
LRAGRRGTERETADAWARELIVHIEQMDRDDDFYDQMVLVLRERFDRDLARDATANAQGLTGSRPIVPGPGQHLLR